MRIDVWDVFINILLLVFWFKIWNRNERDSFFNPYLATVNRFANAAINFLRPVFFRLPDTTICIISIVFIIIFRAVVFSGITMHPNASPWHLHLSAYLSDHVAVPNSILSCMAFSVASFLIFLFRIWSVTLLYLSRNRGTVSGHTQSALHQVSAPFVFGRAELRPVYIITAGILIQLLLNFTGPTTPANPSWMNIPPGNYISRLVIISMAGWIEVFVVVQFAVMFLIIGSWISIFTSSVSIMRLCKEWIDLFLGPLRRYPLMLGMIDLSPIVLFMVLGAVYTFLMGILARSYSIII